MHLPLFLQGLRKKIPGELPELPQLPS